MEHYIGIVLDAIKYIEEHIEDKITLEEISDSVYLSKFHFHRLFQMITHLPLLITSLTGYILTVRQRADRHDRKQ